jgi:hypothetical protein
MLLNLTIATLLLASPAAFSADKITAFQESADISSAPLPPQTPQCSPGEVLVTPLPVEMREEADGTFTTAFRYYCVKPSSMREIH